MHHKQQHCQAVSPGGQTQLPTLGSCWGQELEHSTLHAFSWSFPHLMINTVCTHTGHKQCLKYQLLPQLGWGKRILACLEEMRELLAQLLWEGRQDSSDSLELWLHHKMSFIYHHLSPKPPQTFHVKKNQQKSFGFLDSNFCLGNDPKWELFGVSFVSLFHKVGFCLASESSSTVNAIN